MLVEESDYSYIVVAICFLALFLIKYILLNHTFTKKY